MEQTKTTTEQKLMRTLMQFNKMSWHQQPVAGCKPSEVRVLFCIKKGRNPHSPEMKVSEISKCLHVTSPTITQALKSLEAHGLIERHIDSIDRRAIGVILTEKGVFSFDTWAHRLFGRGTNESTHRSFIKHVSLLS
jgi:DNA-binding MarR family transcriptional regulator